MAAFTGNYGVIELKRDALKGALKTVLDPADVNVAKQRFSVDFAFGLDIGSDADGVGGTGSQIVPLITGDRVEIWTEQVDANGSLVSPRVPLELVRSNIDAQTDTGSKRTVSTTDIPNSSYSTFWYAVQEIDSGGGIVNGYIQDSGYDYTDGTYTNVSLIDYTAGNVDAGPGSGAIATIAVNGGKVISVQITTAGNGYAVCPYMPDCLKYLHVDEMGGIRLFDTYASCLGGKKDGSLELVEPSSSVPIKIKTRNSVFRSLAQVRDFSVTTTRDTIDTTRLGDQFKRQHDAGLISGQGRINAIWDFRFRECDPMANTGGGAVVPGGVTGTAIAYPEFSQYLANLVIRIQEGADFAAKLFIYYPGDEATVVDKEPSVWYEVACQVTNVAINVSTTKVIESEIEFVTTGPFGLFSDKPPLYLLQEADSSGYSAYIYDESTGEPILLQDVD